MIRLRLAISLALLSVASAALATTYVRVEKDGSKTYSDRPFPGGVPVELESAQTYSAPPVDNSDGSLSAEQRALRGVDDFSYQSCALKPGNDETFTNPENVPITVTLVPALRAGDVVVLTVDGKPVGTNAMSFTLEPADRGTHAVAVTVTNAYGRVVCNSAASFHVLRPSLNMPRRR